jgi:DUF4097 and DUF4098 domain-containing protein YvlB
MMALLLGVTGCDFAGIAGRSQEREAFSYTYKFEPGGRMTVSNFNGSVKVVGWDQNKVEIRGEKYADRKEELAEIKIDIRQSEGAMAVETLAPEKDDKGASYTIHVPHKTELERIESSNGPIKVDAVEGRAKLRTSNGPVHLTGHKGDIEVKTSNGAIALEGFEGAAVLGTSNGPISADGVKGHLEAQTSNGPLNASVSDLAGNRPLRLKTSNGPLTLKVRSSKVPEVVASTSNGPLTVELPASSNATLKAHTSNGVIKNDFPLASTRESSETDLDGTIGSGGPMLDLRTSNGRVAVVKN